MSDTIIYQKKFYHTGPFAYAMPRPVQTDPPVRSFSEFYQVAMNYENIPIPGRAEGSHKFIDAAIALSDTYHLDLEIVRHKSHISARFTLHQANGLSNQDHVLDMADELLILHTQNDALVLSLDYYTHAVLRKGVLCAPDKTRLPPEFLAQFS